jgi:hypothetical protein
MKRGQITIFIILGIVMLLSIGLLFVLRNAILDTKPSYGETGSAQVVQEYMDSCLLSASTRALDEFGLRGATFQSAWTKPITGMAVAYGQKYHANLIPRTEIAELELEKAISRNFKKCGDPGQISGVNAIATAEPNITIILGDKSVDVNMRYPLEITRSGSHASMQEFSIKLPVQLKSTLQYANDLINVAEAEPDYLDLKTLDYSCGKAMACHSDGLVRIYSYNDLKRNPAFTLQFIVEDKILDGCTSMEGWAACS